MNIGVIGNGFVGNSIYHTFSPQFDVKVYDVNKARATHMYDETIMESDIIFMCLPTPMRHGGDIDLSYILEAFEQVANFMKRNNTSVDEKVFVIKSTVVPNTTAKLIEKYGLNIIFSPEFLTERTAVSDSICSNHVVLGGEPNSIQPVAELYAKRFGRAYQIFPTTTQTAEFIKYMRNTYFATKVTFMNEMFRIAINAGVDWEDAVSGFAMDGRIGHSHLSVPGHDGKYGFGGTCFPKDLNALIALSESQGFCPELLSRVESANIKYRGMEDWKEDVGRAVSV